MTSTGRLRYVKLKSNFTDETLMCIFQELTVSTLATYVIGERIKAAEAMTVDLAVTRL